MEAIRDTIVLTSTWNSSDLIDLFVDHYLKLGVNRIMVMDYGSNDDTIEKLKAKRNIEIEIFKLAQIKDSDSSNELLAIAQERFPNSKALFCDPDEFLVTPNMHINDLVKELSISCLLYTSPSPRDQRGSRMPSSA